MGMAGQWRSGGNLTGRDITSWQICLTSEVIGADEVGLAMSNLQIKGGMPYYFDETGLEVLRAILSRRIRIKAMFAHFPSMIRLTRVLSVN